MIWPNDAEPRTRSAMPGARRVARDRRQIGRAEREVDQHHPRPAWQSVARERDRGHRRADIARRADHGDPAGQLSPAAPRSLRQLLDRFERHARPVDGGDCGAACGSGCGMRGTAAAADGRAASMSASDLCGCGHAGARRRGECDRAARALRPRVRRSGRSPTTARTSPAPQPARSAASSARPACSRRPRSR